MSIDHCSTNIWSQQAIEKKPDDNICQYCQFIIEKLRVIMEENKPEVSAPMYEDIIVSLLDLGRYREMAHWCLFDVTKQGTHRRSELNVSFCCWPRIHRVLDFLQCVTMMTQYADDVVALIRTGIVSFLY